MTSTAPSTALTAAPPCPWWCTATPEAHEWSHDHFGGRIGLHHRNVGGFTLYATERIRPGGDSTVEVYGTQTGFVAVRTAAEAAGLAEDLAQVMEILRQVESDRQEVLLA